MFFLPQLLKGFGLSLLVQQQLVVVAEVRLLELCLEVLLELLQRLVVVGLHLAGVLHVVAVYLVLDRLEVLHCLLFGLLVECLFVRLELCSFRCQQRVLLLDVLVGLL